MRGADEQTGGLFSYLSPEAMVPKDHPLRAIRSLVNAALARLSSDFARLYAPTGRASTAPEKLLRALLLQAFYSVRSERQLGAATDGAVDLQYAVPLVRRSVHGRTGLGRDGVHQEP